MARMNNVRYFPQSQTERERMAKKIKKADVPDTGGEADRDIDVERRTIALPGYVWAAVDKHSAHQRRTFHKQIEVILVDYYRLDERIEPVKQDDNYQLPSQQKRVA